jgi:hypothetical protein
LRDLPSRRSLGSYTVGEIPLYFDIPMFPWKDFLMGQIRKVQINKKQKMEERKRKNFYIGGGSQTLSFFLFFNLTSIPRPKRFI